MMRYDDMMRYDELALFFARNNKLPWSHAHFSLHPHVNFII